MPNLSLNAAVLRIPRFRRGYALRALRRQGGGHPLIDLVTSSWVKAARAAANAACQ